jgi:hypothetical protein
MMENNISKIPLFTVNIYSGEEYPETHIINPDGSGRSWAFLCHMESRCYIFSFGEMKFKEISFTEYSRYRANNLVLEINYRANENAWCVIPIGSGRPANLYETESKVEKKKIKSKPKHKARGFVSLSDMDDLSRFIEVDNSELLEGLGNYSLMDK